MAIAIREADIESDRLLLMEAPFHYLTPPSDGPRFDWLYRNNPHGQVRAWIAMDRDRDVIVGSAAAFPRRLYVGDGEEFVWVLARRFPHQRSIPQSRARLTVAAGLSKRSRFGDGRFLLRFS